MKNSCSCSECTKWKKMSSSAAKMDKRTQSSSKRQSWLERTSLFAQGLLQKARSSFKSDPKNGSSHNVITTVQWRFVFTVDPEKEEKR